MKGLKGCYLRLFHRSKLGFVHGRSIAENVLLVQEIMTEIRKRGKPPNLVIKLDMTEAYDRVEWLYLIKVLRRINFE